MAVFKNDIGTIIRVDTGFDLTNATIANLVILKPNKQEVVWTGAMSTAGTTLIDYTITSNDLDVTGDYLVQSYVEFASPTSWSGRGITTTLVVKDYFA